MRALLIILSLSLALPVQAQPSEKTDVSSWRPRLHIHGPSHHVGGDDAWNNSTWGGGIEFEQARPSYHRSILFGTYYNSVSVQSLYAGVAASWEIFPLVHLGAGLGLVTGYGGERCTRERVGNQIKTQCISSPIQYPVIPMLWPTIMVGNALQLRIVGHPANDGALHLMVSVRL